MKILLITRFDDGRIFFIEGQGPAKIGNGTGNPGVFQGYPYPNPSLPTPTEWGMGFDGYGLRVIRDM